jgi:hypothetical protein
MYEEFQKKDKIDDHSHFIVGSIISFTEIQLIEI